MAKGFTMKREEGMWIIRTYVVGQTGEKIKFRIPNTIGKNREKIRREVRRQEKKATNGLRGIARVVNENFYRQNGYLVELTYTDDALLALEKEMPEGLDPNQQRDYIWDAAQHQMELCFRRVRRKCKAVGTEFKYWGITSDLDKDGLPCRVHHHVIVDSESAAFFREKWTAGKVHTDQLWDEPDHNDLVAYLLQQVRADKHEKRYTPSRNLVHPQPKDRTVYSNAELAVPHGARLICRDEMGKGAPQYIRYVLPTWGFAADEEDPDSDGRAGAIEFPRGRARSAGSDDEEAMTDGIPL